MYVIQFSMPSFSYMGLETTCTSITYSIIATMEEVQKGTFVPILTISHTVVLVYEKMVPFLMKLDKCSWGVQNTCH